MAKVLVVGLGQMGEAVAWALQTLGCTVYGLDKKWNRVIDCKRKYGILESNSSHTGGDFVLNENIDLVFSCLPYTMTANLATVCRNKNIFYADLGGNPATSKQIYASFKGAWKVCFTDLGLTPGLINIMAEHVMKKQKPRQLTLRVGGLPQTRTNSLGYTLTWSIAGLWNEYIGMCDMVLNGQKIEYKALGYIDQINHDHWNMESSPTKGGLAHTLESAIKNGLELAKYETIRYKGHFEKIIFLLNECKLRNNFDLFEKIISKACPPTKNDKVLLQIETESSKITTSVFATDWTAMQRCTAFPAAVVAYQMINGEFDGIDICHYEHVPIARFSSLLSTFLSESFFDLGEENYE